MTGPHEQFDPRPRLDRPTKHIWDRLVAVEPPVLRWVEDFVYHSVREVLPQWSPRAEVTLHYSIAVPGMKSYLAKAEAEMAALCSAHDYRKLFVLSRLCVGLPGLRRAEGDYIVKTQRRSQGADLWALGCGTRDARASDTFNDKSTIGVALDSPSTRMLYDAVRLNALMDYYRNIVEALRTISVLRLHSGANEGEPGPEVTIDGIATFWTEHNASPRAQATLNFFSHRFSYHREFAAWGFGGLANDGSALRMMIMNWVQTLPDEPFGGGLVFAPGETELDS